MTWVLDMTAMAAALRNEGEMVKLLSESAPGKFALVPPVAAEIEYAIRRSQAGSRRRELLELQKERYFGVLRSLGWSPDASRIFGETKANLEHAGTLVDDLDIAVAAIALAHGAGVVTANLVHYSRIPRLRARHWREGISAG
jgi:tRNA(fMet)-specific endonuclease VapC